MIASREKTVLDAAIQRYVERNPTSLDIHKRALDYLPGGNTRTTLYSPPFPVSMKRGQGYQLYDEDGHE
jgi:glutamate-1-semialdehyde 2,1-aminomutase